MKYTAAQSITLINNVCVSVSVCVCVWIRGCVVGIAESHNIDNWSVGLIMYKFMRYWWTTRNSNIICLSTK